ncbi:MAG: acyl carrier protein [Syntrophales bacterium]|nr:acyl carrier protein [Syntrophales bacterium]
MDAVIKKIIEGIREIFLELGDQPLTAETRLGDIPGFDSMAAVNLQTFLEETFKVSVFLEILNEETTIEEVALYITDPQKMVQAVRRG